MTYRFYLMSFLILFCSLVLPSADGISADQEIPLEQAQWQSLRYGNIEPNVVTWRNGKLQIQVDNSASPLIYPLQTPIIVSSLELRAKINGTVTLPDRGQQEGPAVNDFRLQVGLVYAGDTRMGFMQSLVAPDWLNTLFRLAPKDRGISRVEFYSTWLDPRLAGVDNLQNGDEWLHQHFALEVGVDGVVDQQISVPTDEAVVAIWISSDGDGTGSVFEVQIERIKLFSVP